MKFFVGATVDEHVYACFEPRYESVFDVFDRAHHHVVGDDDAVEIQGFSQDIFDDFFGQGGGKAVEQGVNDVRDHHCGQVVQEFEGFQVEFGGSAVKIDERKFDVGVGRGVAVPGKVLADGDYAVFFVDVRNDFREPCDIVGVAREGAFADDGVSGVGIHVEYGSEVHVYAERRKFGTQLFRLVSDEIFAFFGGKLCAEVFFAVVEVFGAFDATAFLVDTQQRRGFCQTFNRFDVFSEAFRGSDILREKNHAAEPRAKKFRKLFVVFGVSAVIACDEQGFYAFVQCLHRLKILNSPGSSLSKQRYFSDVSGQFTVLKSLIPSS
mgnify:CR=1 FL=1